MSQDSYALSRDSTETERLEAQHVEWTKNIGYLLHPSIRHTVEPNDRIADVGCGSGTWLLELSCHLPGTCEYTGFDIASTQFRAADALPAGVELLVADAKKPFPPEHHGKYDVVHLRLLVAALDAHEWETVARNCVQLLKPGGHIQWDEANFARARQALRGEVDSTVADLNRLNEVFPEVLRARFEHGWSDLARVFSELGLQDVQVDLVSSDRLLEHRHTATRNTVAAIWSLLRDMETKMGKTIVPEDKLKELMEGVEKDVRSGAYIRYDIHVFTARKPL
ncbi:MAG: hypothetical protein M1828_004460 [Chrysothrix sp. TS-e1954]|nr:MAG: hypothetical protein M1828_004460 [Chrysothrix sp. TS-e1954]